MLSSFNVIDNHSPLLLSISFNANKEFPDEISLYDAIQLKNYINSYWRNNSNNINDEDNIIINEEDIKNIRHSDICYWNWKYNNIKKI